MSTEAQGALLTKLVAAQDALGGCQRTQFCIGMRSAHILGGASKPQGV